MFIELFAFVLLYCNVFLSGWVEVSSPPSQRAESGRKCAPIVQVCVSDAPAVHSLRAVSRLEPAFHYVIGSTSPFEGRRGSEGALRAFQTR